MSLSRNVSEINGDFIQNRKFLPPRLSCAPLRRFGLELDQKTRMMGPRGRERSFKVSSAVWIQHTNVTDRRRDRQTPGDSKDRAYAYRRAVVT